MSRCHKNTWKWCKCPILTYGQCFFLGKCLIGPTQVSYFGIGYSRRKNPAECVCVCVGAGGGGFRTYFFLKKTLELCWFFLYLLEISGKTKLHPWEFGKIMYVSFLWNFQAKNQDLWKFSLNFSWFPLDVPRCF